MRTIIEDRLTALEKEFNEYKRVLYSTADCACDLMRRIAEDHGLIDEEFEEKLTKIESRVKKQHPPR